MAFFENEIGVPVDLLTIDYDRYIELNNEIGYIYKTINQPRRRADGVWLVLIGMDFMRV
jgi:hypothetical protein